MHLLEYEPEDEPVVEAADVVENELVASAIEGAISSRDEPENWSPYGDVRLYTVDRASEQELHEASCHLESVGDGQPVYVEYDDEFLRLGAAGDD